MCLRVTPHKEHRKPFVHNFSIPGDLVEVVALKTFISVPFQPSLCTGSLGILPVPGKALRQWRVGHKQPSAHRTKCWGGLGRVAPGLVHMWKGHPLWSFWPGGGTWPFYSFQGKDFAISLGVGSWGEWWLVRKCSFLSHNALLCQNTGMGYGGYLSFSAMGGLTNEVHLSFWLLSLSNPVCFSCSQSVVRRFSQSVLGCDLGHWTSSWQP